MDPKATRMAIAQLRESIDALEEECGLGHDEEEPDEVLPSSEKMGRKRGRHASYEKNREKARKGFGGEKSEEGEESE